MTKEKKEQEASLSLEEKRLIEIREEVKVNWEPQVNFGQQDTLIISILVILSQQI